MHSLSYENEFSDKTHFHKKGCALGLALKKRHKTTRKWPIVPYEVYTKAVVTTKVVFLRDKDTKLELHYVKGRAQTR